MQRRIRSKAAAMLFPNKRLADREKRRNQSGQIMSGNHGTGEGEEVQVAKKEEKSVSAKKKFVREERERVGGHYN